MKRAVLAAMCVMSCGRAGASSAPLFKRLASGHTGITFANTITVTDSVNVLTDPAGVLRSATSITTACRTSSSRATWFRVAST